MLLTAFQTAGDQVTDSIMLLTAFQTAGGQVTDSIMLITAFHTAGVQVTVTNSILKRTLFGVSDFPLSKFQHQWTDFDNV